jgi:hypothetical protein
MTEVQAAGETALGTGTRGRFFRKEHCCQDEQPPAPKTDYRTTYTVNHNGKMPHKSPQVALTVKQPAESGLAFGKGPLGTTEYRDEYFRKREKPIQEAEYATKGFPDTGTTYGPTFLSQKNLPPLRREPSMKMMAAIPPTTNNHFFPPKLNQLRPNLSTPQLHSPEMPFRGSTTYDNHFVDHPIRPRYDKIYNYRNRCEKVRREKEIL